MRKWIVSILISLLVFAACMTPGMAYPSPSDIEIAVVTAPASPLTTQWCFVIDNSRSMRDVFYKARGAFLEAVRLPGDQLEYSLVAFNNQGMDRFRPWEWASADSFKEADKWIRDDKHGGVLSYGATAIATALRQEKRELTVLIISDGGFTEVSRAGGSWDVIRRVFVEGQQWREKKDLPPAIVTCIGISNPSYTAGNKPSDADCQTFLNEIGTRYKGGYFLVTGAIK